MWIFRGRGLESLQLKFLVLKCRNQILDQDDGLALLTGGPDRQFEVTIGLELRRFLAEGALDAFTDLQFGPRSGALKVRESISSEVFDFRK
jgi:hypothetical protein